MEAGIDIQIHWQAASPTMNQRVRRIVEEAMDRLMDRLVLIDDLDPDINMSLTSGEAA
jgi:hypothetical protein